MLSSKVLSPLPSSHRATRTPCAKQSGTGFRHSRLIARNANDGQSSTSTTQPQNSQPEMPPPSASSSKVNSALSTLDALLPEEKEEKKPSPPKPSPSPPPPQQSSFTEWPTVPKPQPERKQAPERKKSFTFDQVMAFEGIAPEIINARCAMLGFMFAINAETATGESVFAQLLTGGAGKAFAVIIAVIIASFAPAIVRQVPMDECFNKDEKKERSFGPFNNNAEIRNGRAAMIGIALILLLEGGSGTAFFI